MTIRDFEHDDAITRLHQEFDGKNPIRLADGKVGLIIRLLSASNEVGAQVPLEPDIRWIPFSRIGYAKEMFLERDEGTGSD